MKLALVVVMAALPLAAQPKLLVNAQLDTRSGAANFDQQFRSVVAQQPQPAWISYSVQAVRGYNLGCDYVSPDGWTAPGVIHLEPAAEAIVLFRVVNNAVERVRAIAPHCQIDAGGAPVHWFADVAAAASVALLSEFAARQEKPGDAAMLAIAVHADASAGAALERFSAPDQPEWLRLRAVSRMSPRGIDLLKKIATTDTSMNVRKRAMSSLGSSHDPAATAFFEEILKR